MRLIGKLIILSISLSSCFAFAIGQDDPKDPKSTTVTNVTKIAKWQAAAVKGEPWACFNLGLAYHLGKETSVDSAEAIKWYRAAAEQGYAPAQANLGYCYDSGFGVPVDPAEAVRWYQMAALQGNAYAQYNLGKKYQSGPGVSIDPKSAERFLKQAAQQNFVPAFFSLGQIFADESGGKPDYREAYKWFRMAADQGYAAAQHAIGYLYFSGKGVQTNYFEAVKWYNQAASRNFADSHYNLAICYERGWGVPQNLTVAVNHFRTAAEFGHRFAQYSLGVCYYEGKGLEVDLVQAYKWWNLAAVQGVPEAASSREILSRLLSENQIKEGQRLASEFVVRNSTPAESSRVIQVASPDVAEIRRVGTGVIISPDGYILTTSRVISGGKNVQVITEGGTFNADITKVDSLNDIALLKIAGVFQFLPVAPSNEVQAGSEIVVLGFDADNRGQFNPKVAHGKIKSLIGHLGDPRQYSIDPRITSGFAGAGIVNKSGQVLGLLLSEPEAKPSASHTNSAPSTSFALKSDHLIGFLRGVPEVKASFSPAKDPKDAPATDPLSKARVATALILVL